jgi:hypothetical protein
MTTSSDDSVELEAKTVTTPHPSHHKSRHRKRIAARIALILGLVVGFVAVSDFAYNAYEKANGFDVISIVGANGRRVPQVDPTLDPELIHFEERQQLDAVAAVLAAAFLITSTVISRTVKKHRR